MNTVATWRRLLAEFVGTALLVTAVVGSGVMATTLSLLAALDLADAALAPLAVQTRFFALDVRVEHDGAQFVSSALFELDAGHARLLARRWTLPE